MSSDQIGDVAAAASMQIAISEHYQAAAIAACAARITYQAASGPGEVTPVPDDLARELALHAQSYTLHKFGCGAGCAGPGEEY